LRLHESLHYFPGASKLRVLVALGQCRRAVLASRRTGHTVDRAIRILTSVCNRRRLRHQCRNLLFPSSAQTFDAIPHLSDQILCGVRFGGHLHLHLNEEDIRPLRRPPGAQSQRSAAEIAVETQMQIISFAKAPKGRVCNQKNRPDKRSHKNGNPVAPRFEYLTGLPRNQERLSELPPWRKPVRPWLDYSSPPPLNAYDEPHQEHSRD
jgi:hypothetical protein